MDAKRTIRVTGRGMLKLKPDVTRLTMTLQGVYPEYQDALTHASLDGEALKDLLSPLGFAREAVKTLSFNVDMRYEDYQDENHVYKQRFAGYAFTHVLKVEFPSDNALLGRALYALAHGKLAVEFRISYTIADPEAAKNQLLAQAVADAKAKAAALTAAADVSLKELRHIDYSWDQMNVSVQAARGVMAEDRAMPMMAKASYDMSIEPEDIELSDTVTLVWSIE